MWVKICGIRDLETAQGVARAGADAIGLNFAEVSPRRVLPDVAAAIVAAVGNTIEPVGVFVNQPVGEIRRIAHECALRTIQLHGDEPAELAAELARDFRVIRAVRLAAGADEWRPLADCLPACQRLQSSLWACLVDSRVPGRYGGSGTAPPWDAIRRDYQRDVWPPLILAGGLRPGNVAAAIAAVDPWGVDVAGGVESSLACKDDALVREFVLNAKRASD